jgi:hypothetical protein
LGVAFFTLLQFLPQALTANDFPPPHLVFGFAVSIGVFITCGMLASREMRGSTFSPLSQFTGSLVWILAIWVLAQTVLHPGWGELLRALAFASLLLSANSLGRYLSVNGRYRLFMAGLGPFFAFGYLAGLSIAVFNPGSIWWGHGLFGDSHARSWFFWLLTPQPLFAAAAFYWARSKATSAKVAKFYTLCIVGLIVLILLTRTRTYVITVLGFVILIFAGKSITRMLLMITAAILAILATPGALSEFAALTRLSSFTTGIDPVSGSSDVTNARGELSSRLFDLFSQSPATGVGASTVRNSVADLAASSEAGILLSLASYGVLSLLLLAVAALALFRSLSQIAAGSDHHALHSLVIIIAPFSTILFFGSATGYSDWLGLCLIITGINVASAKASEAGE